MNELIIELKYQKDKKQELQIKIAKIFDYGRWPNDDDFLSLYPILINLIKIQSKIDGFEEVIKAIESNANNLKVINK